MAAGDTASLRDKAKTAFNGKNYSEAIGLYSELIDAAKTEDPDLHLYYSNRCACYQIQKQWNNALDDAQSCVSFMPAWVKGHMRLATCLGALGRRPGSARAWARANELDPNNASIRQSYHSACRVAGMPIPDGGHDGDFGAGGGGGFSGFNFDGITNIKDVLNQLLAQFMVQFNLLSWETKVGYGLVIVAVIYYILQSMYRFFFPSFVDYGYDDYDGVGYGESYYHGGGGYSRGLSWPAWGLIMAAAYYVPPKLPASVCPPQYAQPFFGMNFTTFVWLLRMFTTSGGGGGFMGGGPGFMGGRRRRYY